MSAIQKPSDVRNSFAGKGPTKYHTPNLSGSREKRIQRTNFWPGKRLDYSRLEQLKEFVCRVKHPTAYYKRAKDAEYRVSILHWSRGSYLDIRMYYGGHPTAMGLLMHQDVASIIVPELFAALRTLEMNDTREEEQKAKPELIKI